MTDRLWLGEDFDEASTAPLNFIETRLHDLSPFSAHEVVLDGVVYKTAEHAYQAGRVTRECAEKIRAARSPLDAWRIAQQAKKDNQITEHDKDALMERIFRAKLAQHEDVRRVLLCTKDRELKKVFDTDYYWGTGADGSGQNRMGLLWMKLRTELRNQQ